MNALTPFAYGDQPVRVVTIDGEPWFVLADLVRILGLRQFRADRLDDGLTRNHPIEDRLGRAQQATVVSEAGMYEVVIRSDKPEAAAFRRWITSEVLPAIRKTGRYETAPISLESLADIGRILDAGKAALNRAIAAEARAEVAEATVGAIAAAEGITPRQFHKHYFSDVPERDFFEHLYRLGLLIDQRGSRGRDDKGRLKNGHEHGHPGYRGKPYLYLHGRLDSTGIRRESTRVRPGDPELDLARLLASKGLPVNSNSKRHLYPKELAA